MSGFHSGTFCYYRFLLEIEFKMQLGVWGTLKPLAKTALKISKTSRNGTIFRL